MILSNGQTLNFAPQALGETAPIAASTGYYYADQGLDLVGAFAVYGELYRSQAWLATVIDKIADAAARLSFNVWDNTPKTGKALDLTSPYARLWQRPCPEMPTYAFWRWTQTTYELYGEAFWLKMRDADRRVIGLLPMHPSRTAIHRDKDGNVIYVFALGVASAGLLHAPAEDVVPFLRYNPDNIMRGLSRAESLRSTLLNEDSSRRAIESWWKRGARPALMISAPQALSQGAYDRLSKAVDKVHGGADNAGGTLVLEEGAKPVPVQLSAEEMQYISSRQLNREEVCGRYDVPPPVVHILDHATFSNITEQMRSMYRDTMAPRLEDLESTIDHHLRPDFDPFGNVAGRFALDEVLRGDFETRATAVGKLITQGVMKPSEARPLFDLADAGPVADKLYANSALQELGTPAERITIRADAQPSAQEVLDAAAAEAAVGETPGVAQQPPKTTAPQQSTRAARRRVRRSGQWHKDDTKEQA